LSMLDLGIIQN